MAWMQRPEGKDPAEMIKVYHFRTHNKTGARNW
jgi:hypothetical protein